MTDPPALPLLRGNSCWGELKSSFVSAVSRGAPGFCNTKWLPFWERKACLCHTRFMLRALKLLSPSQMFLMDYSPWVWGSREGPRNTKSWGNLRKRKKHQDARRADRWALWGVEGCASTVLGPDQEEDAFVRTDGTALALTNTAAIAEFQPCHKCQKTILKDCINQSAREEKLTWVGYSVHKELSWHPGWQISLIPITCSVNDFIIPGFGFWRCPVTHSRQSDECLI